ncbi:MAG: ATP-binding cassette domain-containing protein, partial [Eudoraea sp.]|uniref:peptidase domain-containing ABC transporter n=1 Tax=Eudoraea sp. TaxID=1979955 RepID=UPI003C752318
NRVFSGASSNTIAQILTIILLWSRSGFVIERQITPGELLSFYAIVGYFTGPLISLIGANKEIQNALIAADRLFEILDLEREEVENKIELTKNSLGDIKFKEVNFCYGTRTEVFQNFNVTIEKGKITALVGESGSGKSTLMSLLQNIYSINKGSITIGDIDLKYIDNDSLRKLISVVPQKIDLFAGNIIENIAVGEFEPDMDFILKICAEIGILEFIEGLPNGFNTYLGENGATLSGGQKQRIAIARALYKKPEVLVLDEATSSLDSSSENFVQKTIDKLRSEAKTIVIIAHRLSTVVNSDKIVVLENGKVLEQGSHEILFEKKGAYYNLWRKQLPKFILKLKSAS